MIRRCPRYPDCLVATTIEERRYCPTHGARLVSAETLCVACGAAVLPDERFCAGCGAAQTADAQRSRPATAPRSSIAEYATSEVYVWLFVRRGDTFTRLRTAVCAARAVEPNEIRCAIEAFVRAAVLNASPLTGPDAELRATLADIALDAVDWDQIVEDYLERERRDAAEDRAEARAEDRA